MPVRIPELDPDPKRGTPNEWTIVERPLLQQWVAMGWEYLEGTGLGLSRNPPGHGYRIFIRFLSRDNL